MEASECIKERKNTNRNFSVYGYSPVINLLTLKQNIRQGLVPDYAVFTFAAFNEERIVFTHQFKKLFYREENHLPNSFSYPFYQYEEDSLRIDYATFNDKGFVGHWDIRLTNLFGQLWYRNHKQRLRAKEVHAVIMLERIKICKDNNIVPILFDLSSDQKETEQHKMFEKAGAVVLTTSVDYMDKGFNLLPYDNHPNDTATSSYKNELVELLDSLVCISL